MTSIQNGYKDIIYHNKTHGIDVSQYAYYFATRCEMREILELDDLDLVSLIVAGSIHDFEHFGYTNQYLVETKHPWAMTYNDTAVLEAHHVSAAFQLMHSNTELDIFQHTSKENYKALRKRIVAMVLATDMASHFDHLELLNTMGSNHEFFVNQKTEKDQIFLMSMAVHAADLANPTKDWLISMRWGYMVMEEFFLQGDVEKKSNLPIGFLNDRTKINIANSQIGFMDMFVLPTFTAFTKILPNMKERVDQAKKNQSRFKDM